MNVYKIVVSEKFPFAMKGFNYFVGCKKNKDVTTLWVQLQKRSGYLKKFNDAKTISIFVKDKKSLIKYNEMWSKVKKYYGKKKIDSSLLFDNRYVRIKIKSYNNKSKSPKMYLSQNVTKVMKWYGKFLWW